MKIKGLLLSIMFILSLATAQGQILLSSLTEANQSNSIQLRSNGAKRFAQSFTPAQSLKLYSTSFYLSKLGSPTGNITISLYAHTGTFGTSTGLPTGSALATSDAISISTITTSFVLYSFNFPVTRYALTSYTPYCIVVNYSGGDASNYLLVAQDGTSPTHPGYSAYSTSTTWTANAGDMIHYIYGETPPPPPPTPALFLGIQF